MNKNFRGLADSLILSKKSGESAFTSSLSIDSDVIFSPGAQCARYLFYHEKRATPEGWLSQLSLLSVKYERLVVIKSLEGRLDESALYEGPM